MLTENEFEIHSVMNWHWNVKLGNEEKILPLIPSFMIRWRICAYESSLPYASTNETRLYFWHITRGGGEGMDLIKKMASPFPPLPLHP